MKWRNFDPNVYPFVRGELWEDVASGETFWVARATQSVDVHVDNERATLIPGTAYLPLDNSYTDFWSFDEAGTIAAGNRQYAPLHSRPEDFGAGTTTASLQWVFNAAAAIGGTVELTAGRVYTILGGTLTIPAGCFINGNGATIQLANGATGRALIIQNKTGRIAIRNLTIDLNKANTVDGGTTVNQQGIYLSTNVACDDVTLENIKVINGWRRGIHVQATAPVTNLNILSCTVNDVGADGIYIVGADSAQPANIYAAHSSHTLTIRDCKVNRPGIAGIQVICFSDVTCRDNHLDGNGTATGHGICFSTSGTYQYVNDFIIAGNQVKGFTSTTGQAKWGICVSVNCNRFRVVDNDVYNCAGLITIDVEDGSNLGALVNVSSVVKGNTCNGATNTHGINARICKGLTIVSNVCNDGAAYGIVLSNAFACTVGMNTCNNNTAYPVSLAGNNAGTGGHTVGPNGMSGNGLGDTVNIATPAPPIASKFVTAA